MPTDDNKILTMQQIRHKISRIAWEVFENNYTEKKIYIAGIPSGYKLAKLLAKELQKISPFQVELLKIELKKGPENKEIIQVDCNPEELADHVLLLVDDVLHTGRTFLQSLRPFMDVKVKKIETAVLINRSHKMYPISADYTGYQLATTLNDHIKVVLDSGKYGVYLY